MARGYKEQTKSIEELADNYEDDKNSMIAVTESDQADLYDDFYGEFDNRLIIESSMNMIFFGPISSFMRIDPETILHVLLNTKKHLIPRSRVLLAWDIITDGKTAAFLKGREYLAFGTLINLVPEEDLYYANLGDKSVLRYFANTDIELKSRKVGILAAAYMRYYGKEWYSKSTYIDELGGLVCGFPPYTLRKIKPKIFINISSYTFGKLKRCNFEQIKTLYNIAVHSDAYGTPYKWSSYEITRLNELFICVPNEDISGVQIEAIAALSPTVMKKMHLEKLQYFTKQQIMTMYPETRRIYILRMQLKNSLDINQLAKRCIMIIPWNFVIILIILLFIDTLVV